MEEPNLCVPRPSPYPPSRLADTSFSLEVTPERAAERERKPVRNSQVKSSKFQIPSAQPGQVQSSISDERPIPPSLLSAPHINSSTRLYNKLTTFKQHRHVQLPATIDSTTCIYAATAQAQSNQSNNGQEHPHSTSQCTLSSKQAASSMCSDVTDLESMASTKPLQEVNIPRHKSRYSDLPPVDISNESFQRLTFKPRKKEVKGKSGKNTSAATGKELAEAPSVMEFFSLELEWDEAEWSIEPPPSVGHTPQNDRSLLSYATVPDDAAFTLYRHMQTWNQ